MNKNNIEDLEFNNLDEDEDIIKENNHYKSLLNNKNSNNSNNENKKNIIPFVIIGILIVAVIILLIALLSKDDKKSESGEGNSNNSNNSSSEKNDTNNDDNKNDNTSKTYDVNMKDSILVLNKYVLIKEDKKMVVVDLDGNKIDDINIEKDDDIKYFIDNKDLYFIKSSDKKSIVYKLIDKNIKELNTLEGTKNGFLVNDKEEILGTYDTYSNKEVLYLINKDDYNKIEIDNYTIGSTSKQSNYKNIYNDKYAITIKGNSFGIYNVKDGNELIEPKYNKIEYLTKDNFAAEKNDAFGIIDVNDKKLLDFKYDSIKYENGLYFAIDNNYLSILDSSFKEITKVSNINNSSNRVLISTFGDYVIYLANRAIASDKKGNVTDLNFDDFYVFGNYLITSKSDSTIVTLYDKKLEVVSEYDTKTKDNDLSNSGLFLNSVLVLNGGECFDLATGKSKGHINLYRRTSQGYLVAFELNKDGLITISYNDQVLGEVKGVKLMDFLNSNNNGITITKNHFIYSAGEIHFITKNVKEDS